jgi:hypothetical protein
VAVTVEVATLDVGGEVEVLEVVMTKLAGRRLARAVRFHTSPGSSKELGAVGQPATFWVLYAQMKSG